MLHFYKFIPKIAVFFLKLILSYYSKPFISSYHFKNLVNVLHTHYTYKRGACNEVFTRHRQNKNFIGCWGFLRSNSPRIIYLQYLCTLLCTTESTRLSTYVEQPLALSQSCSVDSMKYIMFTT